MNRQRRHARNRSRGKNFAPRIALNRLTNLVDAVRTTAYGYDAAFHEMFGCCPGLYPLKTPTQRLR